MSGGNGSSAPQDLGRATPEGGLAEGLGGSGLSVLQSGSRWLGPGGDDGPRAVPEVWEPLWGRLPGPREPRGQVLFPGPGLVLMGPSDFRHAAPFRKVVPYKPKTVSVQLWLWSPRATSELCHLALHALISPLLCGGSVSCLAAFAGFQGSWQTVLGPPRLLGASVRPSGRHPDFWVQPAAPPVLCDLPADGRGHGSLPPSAPDWTDVRSTRRPGWLLRQGSPAHPPPRSRGGLSRHHSFLD